ncbi:hypothetical protein WOLCODRAFT_155956 [Wolfiporia cocos MD-104 SS10]|uniref:Uncharacterized protein n=1 Tax=Wolfiporia cocos (strain MD-104) TaxID=742152 RepID=A0A2H3JC72_WOLCO|nr:hypothetical protein WOLCODRAFT_155956 [Wolfiporia cocos MD-104 SS10]
MSTSRSQPTHRTPAVADYRGPRQSRRNTPRGEEGQRPRGTPQRTHSPQHLQIRHALLWYRAEGPFAGRANGWTDLFDISQDLTHVYNTYINITEDLVRMQGEIHRQREDLGGLIDRLIDRLAATTSSRVRHALNDFEDREHVTPDRPAYTPRPSRLFTNDERGRVARPSPAEQELENRRNVFLVWEATGDANHLHARRALGLPQPTTTADIAQRLFDELRQLRSLPGRSTRELRGSTSETPPPYPDGPHRTWPEHITTNGTAQMNISEISLRSGYQRGPLPNNPADNVDPRATGSSTVPTIFAGVVDSINQVIDRMSAGSTLFGEPRRPPPSAETETFTTNRTPRPSEDTGRDLSGTTNA